MNSFSDISFQFVATLLIFTVVSCDRPPGFEIGGGGSRHRPPEFAERSQPLELTLELLTWGEGSKRIQDRYGNVSCVIKAGNSIQTELPGVLVLAEQERAVYSVTIPTNLMEEADQLTYYFKFRFDGNEDAGHTNSVPVR